MHTVDRMGRIYGVSYARSPEGAIKHEAHYKMMSQTTICFFFLKKKKKRMSRTTTI